MLTPVIRHGVTYWEAPRSTRPPLPDLPVPHERRTAPSRAKDMSPEAIALRERKKSSRLALAARANEPVQIPIEIPSSLKAIQEAVMASFGIQPNEFFARSKANRIALPRIASMALCRELTDHSLETIGRAHGKDNHATVLYACERFEDLREIDADYRARAEKAEDAIRGL